MILAKFAWESRAAYRAQRRCSFDGESSIKLLDARDDFSSSSFFDREHSLFYFLSFYLWIDLAYTKIYTYLLYDFSKYEDCNYFEMKRTKVRENKAYSDGEIV